MRILDLLLPIGVRECSYSKLKEPMEIEIRSLGAREYPLVAFLLALEYYTVVAGSSAPAGVHALPPLPHAPWPWHIHCNIATLQHPRPVPKVQSKCWSLSHASRRQNPAVLLGVCRLRI